MNGLRPSRGGDNAWKPQPREVIAEWIDKVNCLGRQLTDWDLSFMKTVTKYVERGWSLSQKQEEILENLYTEKVK